MSGLLLTYSSFCSFYLDDHHEAGIECFQGHCPIYLNAAPSHFNIGLQLDDSLRYAAELAPARFPLNHPTDDRESIPRPSGCFLEGGLVPSSPSPRPQVNL
jgi:hypothetical protein